MMLADDKTRLDEETEVLMRESMSQGFINVTNHSMKIPIAYSWIKLLLREIDALRQETK